MQAHLSEELEGAAAEVGEDGVCINMPQLSMLHRTGAHSPY
jgi:hypothetical protein